MNEPDVCRLTKEQQRAFNRLKKAMRDCKRLEVYFANVYGTMLAFDKAKVSNYGFKEDLKGFEVIDSLHLAGHPDSVQIPDAFCDDEILHSIALTEKGSKIYHGKE